MAGRAGDYCAIQTVMADDPDFRTLSPDAKLLIYTLKMILGPSGIDVVRAFGQQMRELTGLGEDRFRAALEECVRADWVRIQWPTVWLRNGLRFNPSLTLANDKHKAGILRHLRSLPACEIVNAFAAYYELPEIAKGKGIEWVYNGYGNPEYGSRNTDTESVTETRAKALGASAGFESSRQNGVRDPWDEPEPDPDEPPADAKNLKAQLAYFMPLLRRLNYSADDHDGSILKALLSGKAPRSPPSIDKAIRGLAWARDKGALRDEMGLGPDDQLSMKILYSDKGVRPTWQKAVDEWYPKSLWKPKGSKDPGLSPIRVV